MPPIFGPVNEIQERFNELLRGRSTADRNQVQLLLCDAGKRLNARGFEEVGRTLRVHHEYNPWHVCFALGLCWGHLAQFHQDFIGAAVRALKNWNSEDLKLACSFHNERGAEPIEHSLMGAHTLFAKVTLPRELPSNLDGLTSLQDRWLSPVLGPKDARPKYIGSWNATAMFMMALFAQPDLAATMVQPRPVLPPGGPIVAGLSLLHKAGIVSGKPAGNALEEQDAWPGSLYLNNALMAEILPGLANWSLVDIHSGVYLLGTKDSASRNWI